MAYYIEQLLNNNQKPHAKMLFLKNQEILTPLLDQKILDKLSQITYNSMFGLEKENKFGPLTQPTEKQLHLPENIKVTWISSKDQIPQLSILKKEPYIGVDSEWRCVLTNFNKTKVSLLQIGGEKEIFLIDMVALESSLELDDMLCSIFTNPTSHILGYGFSADTTKFTKTLPHFNFMRNIP